MSFSTTNVDSTKAPRRKLQEFTTFENDFSHISLIEKKAHESL